MLINLKALKNYSIKASNGEIGSIVDFYFDDQEWLIRYLVIETGNWLPGRRVLLSPSVFDLPDESMVELQTYLTKDQIKRSPPMDSQKPVSRQHEVELSEYYAWQPYWLLGIHATPKTDSPLEKDKIQEKLEIERKARDSHLRSFEEVKKYYIEALDGALGTVEDFILGTKDWVIRYLIVDTQKWLPGRKVLISPDWIQGLGSEESRVYVSLKKEEVKNSPEYDSHKSLEKNYEEALHDFYGRRKYWEKVSEVRKTA